ncbi:flagellar hook-length control protein FliK [Virgibacillus subterraneus]|uniref:Flagellar hook-length control protein FliK n=1 Tax=Virgibacillus subterraneus TaxID=621109 RepID=A0A1H9H798_9BACI|nr:flagellar hook-length control protein FliK [Virgibacillus subterraneus]SEQ58202.1 flagellar hook-length control protein FliK [Virgibacillus subterraneus]
MNAIGTIFQQVMQTRGALEQNSRKGTPDKQSVFQNLLSGSKTGVTEQLSSEDNSQDEMSIVNMLMDTSDVQKLINSAASEEEAMQKLVQAIKSIATGKEGSLSEEKAMQMLEATINSIVVDNENGAALKAQVMKMLEGSINKLISEQNGKTEVNVGSFLTYLEQSTVLSNKALQQQFEALSVKAEKLLSQITDQKSASKAAPVLLKLLEQWTALEKKQDMKQAVISQDSFKSSSKEQGIWKELLQSFQKRNQLVSKQQYNSDAKVTSNDVTKWLQHAVGSQANSDKISGQQPMSMTSSIPLSKVEQYVIHMNQNQSNNTVDKQLIDQFQKVMKTSKFLTMQNGTSQLNITLRPENLGDMMVKLTQMNGEMTVKIMVTSHAAKEMLESNMHQLRNMLSPQQVVVEKQEVSSQQAQTNQSEQDDEHNSRQEQGQSNHSEQDDQEEDNDFETQFQNILMNEKV